MIERAAGEQPELRGFFAHDWSKDLYARGGYSSWRGVGGRPPGDDLLARPFGRVHFAGTETAREWRGYIEGALESGERAADEVIAKRGA